MKTYYGHGGWTEWIQPTMKRYRFSCCDCGLVHDLQFRAIKVLLKRRRGQFEYETLPTGKYRVDMRVRRNNRSTALVRRHKTK